MRRWPQCGHCPLKSQNPSLYQQQVTAKVLYIDGHVEVLTPNDKINAYGRFNIR